MVKRTMLSKFISLLVLLSAPCWSVYSQKQVVDQLVAVVGSKIVLQSDVEKQYIQAVAQGYDSDGDIKCEILEQLLTQTLMVNQAEIDSVEVTDGEVEQQLNQRLDYFIRQFGSEDKLVKYFNKSIPEIKEDNRQTIKEEILKQKMQREVLADIQVTPTEVKRFYSSLPADSVPVLPAEVEVSHLVLYPPKSQELEQLVKTRLLELRERIINGEKFSTLAALYSEDPGSSMKGGDIGFMAKGELDPEYARVAFSLKPGQVSKIVESSFGYHIIQMIERQGDLASTRHILMKTKVTPQQSIEIKERLDSIRQVIGLDSLSFSKAALHFSEDEKSRFNGGKMVNVRTNGIRFEQDQLSREDYLSIKTLKVGEVSQPYQATDENGKTIFKIIRIDVRTDPHKANLKDDFPFLKELTAQKKQQEIIDEWVTDKINATYLHIDKAFAGCPFSNPAWLKVAVH